MSDKENEITSDDAKTNEQNDTNEDVKDLEPKKDVKGGGPRGPVI